MWRGIIAAVVVCCSAATAMAGPLSGGQFSPGDDLLLGGIADINGASGPGSCGFGTVAAAFNDGNRDGIHCNGLAIFLGSFP